MRCTVARRCSSTRTAIALGLVVGCAVSIAAQVAPGGKGAAIGKGSPVVDNRMPRPLALLTFVRMGGPDQGNYFQLLMDNTKSAAGPGQMQKVNQFFSVPEPGGKVPGVRMFEVRLAEEVLHETEQPGAPRRTVEDVFLETLKEYGIQISRDELLAGEFVRVAGLYDPITVEVARKRVTEMEAWAKRQPGSASAAELKNPKDAEWVSTLGFNQARLIWAFFTGNIDKTDREKWQVMSYIPTLNDTIGASCPNLYDKSVSTVAEGKSEAHLQSTGMQNRPRGLADLQAVIKSEKEYSDDGEADAKILLEHAPDNCASVILTKVVHNVSLFARLP